MHTPNYVSYIVITEDDDGNAHPAWKTTTMAVQSNQQNLEWRIVNFTTGQVDLEIVWADQVQNPTMGNIVSPNIPTRSVRPVIRNIQNNSAGIHAYHLKVDGKDYLVEDPWVIIF